MKIDQSKLKRQNQALDAWEDNNSQSVVTAATGFGKSYMGILAIKRKLKIHDNLGVIIIVPTDYLRNKWKADINHFGLRDHVKVDTIHSWVKHERLGCHLLILDEIHGYTGGEVFSTIFDRVNYRYILGLTAKERDKEEDRAVLDKYCPIVDRIPLSECLANGWVSPFIIYNWGLELPKEDRVVYDKMHSQFIKYFSTFDFNLGNMYKALMDEDYRERLSKRMLWEPKMIAVHAAQANRIMQKRKTFLQSHPLLLEKAVEIIDQFSDRRIITFSETTDFVDKLHEEIPDSVVYHSSMNTVVRDKESGQTIAEGKKVKISKSDKTRYFDSDNEPLTWKQLKFKYKGLDLERFSGDRLQEESLKAFGDGEVNIIHTAKALNEGVDIQNLDMSIKTSFNSTTIDAIQRSGRIARIDDENPDKRAIEVNLYFKDTQSEKWLRSSQKNGPPTQEITSIEEIV